MPSVLASVVERLKVIWVGDPYWDVWFVPFHWAVVFGRVVTALVWEGTKLVPADVQRRKIVGGRDDQVRLVGELIAQGVGGSDREIVVRGPRRDRREGERGALPGVQVERLPIGELQRELGGGIEPERLSHLQVK